MIKHQEWENNDNNISSNKEDKDDKTSLNTQVMVIKHIKDEDLT